MPFIGLNRVKGGSPAGQAARADRTRQNALAETSPVVNEGGRIDPYNAESVIGGPGGLLEGFGSSQGRTPSISEYLGNLGHVTRYAQAGRGGIGGKDPAEQLVQKAMAIARRMGVKPQDIEDAGQVGAEANLKPGAVGQNPNLVARHAIQDDLAKQVPKGSRSSADYRAIQKTVSDYEQLKGRAAGSEDDFAIYHLFRNSLKPEERAGWTPSKFLDVKNSAPRAGSLSLDDVATSRYGSHETPLHELVAGKGEPSPDQWADFTSRFGKLTPAQQSNFQKYLEGTEIAPSSKARLMGKIGDQPTSQTYKSVKPIAGGSGPVGGDDVTAGFPASDFRVELGRQPRQMFGQEKADVTPGLSKFSQDYNPQLTASSVWKDTNEARPGFGALMGDEQYSLGAGRVAADWDKLRSVLSNLGQLQGRN